MSINKKTEIAQAPAYPAFRHNPRERKVLETSNQYAPTTSADWGSSAPATLDAALDQLASSGAGAANGMAVASVVYDFSVNGGAVGVIPLSVSLPSKAVIVEVIRDELTSCTSTGSTGTIILGVPTEGALEQTALTADGGAVSLASSGGTAVPKKLAAARTLQVTIATNPITAGKIRYFVRYMKSE